MSRKEDEGDDKLYFQMERFVCQDGEWFYTTREGAEKGPFNNREEAEVDLASYLADIQTKQDNDK